MFPDAYTTAEVDYGWKKTKQNGGKGIEIVSDEMAQFELTGVETTSKAATNSKGNFFITLCSVLHEQGHLARVRLKPWLNGLAMSTQVLDLRFVWPPTCINLRRLALTSSSSNLDASKRKFFYCLATQRKSTQVDRK